MININKQEIESLLGQADNKDLKAAIDNLESELKKLITLSKTVIIQGTDWVNIDQHSTDATIKQIKDSSTLMMSLVMMMQHKDSVNSIMDEIQKNVNQLQTLQTLMEHDLERMKEL